MIVPINKSLRAFYAIVSIQVVIVIGVSIFAALKQPPPLVPLSQWGPSWPVTTVELFQVLPRSNAMLLDEELYLGTLDGVRRGQGFYQAQHDMFNQNQRRWNTHSPLTYRQPLLTYLWFALNDGGIIGAFWSTLAGCSMIAAFRANAALVSPFMAMLAPSALCLVYSLLARYSPRVLFSEMWAAPLLVTAGALCALILVDNVKVGSNTKRQWMLSLLGAASALIALLVRELSVSVVAFMLLALLIDCNSRRQWLWVPWAASFWIWFFQYTFHVRQVLTVSQGDPVSPSVPSYFHPGLAFLSACVRWISTAQIFVPIVATLCIMAVIGALTLKRAGLVVLISGLTIGLIGLLFMTGTPGVYSDGSYTGYWGFLFLPVVIAWSPLGLRLFQLKANNRSC